MAQNNLGQIRRAGTWRMHMLDDPAAEVARPLQIGTKRKTSTLGSTSHTEKHAGRVPWPVDGVGASGSLHCGAMWQPARQACRYAQHGRMPLARMVWRVPTSSPGPMQKSMVQLELAWRAGCTGICMLRLPTITPSILLILHACVSKARARAAACMQHSVCSMISGAHVLQ